MATDVKILVIGGGISGLCSAYYLSKYFKPENVLLIEGAARLGGTAYTDRMEGFVCEWGPNGWLDKEPKMKQWLKDLGINDKTITANANAARRFVLRGGKLHEVKPPPGFFFSPLLSMGGRLRLLREPLVGRRKSEQPESVWDFAARRIGPEAADMLVSPMVSGIFAGDAKKLSLEHAFPRMAEMESKYGSLFKALNAISKEKKGVSAMGPSGVLTSFPGGVYTLMEAAGAALGNRVHLNTAATKIEYLDSKFHVQTNSGETYRSEGLVMAIPAVAASRLMAPMDKRQGAALAEIPYAPVLVFCTGFRRADIEHDLNGFGFLAPREQGVRALGCLWTSSIFEHRAPEGYVLLTTMYGGALDPKALDLNDRDLISQFTRDMTALLKIKKQPEFGRIYRHARAIPQYDLNHGERLRTFDYGERQFPGLAYAGNAFRGVGLNDCVVNAHRAVEMMKSRFPYS